MNQLIKYDAACRALSEAKAVDEVKDIRDRAEAMRVYARQAKNRTMEIDAAEIRLRAERRVGEMIVDQKETIGLARPGPKIGSEDDPNSRPTLADAGVDKHLADRARKLAAMPAVEFEQSVGEWRDGLADDKERVTVSFLGAHNHRALGTGDNEWHTPIEYVEAAREVMGGIDLDPATNEIAQARIKATAYCTLETGGLDIAWTGNVWLNPPYSQPEIRHFIDKLVSDYQEGWISQAILLTHNYTDTAWFHHAESAAEAICFTKGRVAFEQPNGDRSSPTQGSAFFSFGCDVEKFVEVFGKFGFIR